MLSVEDYTHFATHKKPLCKKGIARELNVLDLTIEQAKKTSIQKVNLVELLLEVGVRNSQIADLCSETIKENAELSEQR